MRNRYILVIEDGLMTATVTANEPEEDEVVVVEPSVFVRTYQFKTWDDADFVAALDHTAEVLVRVRSGGYNVMVQVGCDKDFPYQNELLAVSSYITERVTMLEAQKTLN